MLRPDLLEFKQSRHLLEGARQIIPGGVNSNVRMGEQPHPIFLESSDGPYLYDADGNCLIDYVMGQGPMLLGHRPDFVVKAVEHQLQTGILYGGQHDLEVAVARLIIGMVPSAEMVRFNMTGTEAVQSALRIARAATDRDLVIKFEGHYHGWADSVLFNVGSSSGPDPESPGIAGQPESAGMAAEAGSSLIVAPWNDPSALAEILEQVGQDVAAVIMEPIMANTGVIEPAAGYLQAVREMCDRYGIVLIFDEVITGFRVGGGGAQGLYGVTPDLTTMGKALASGFPVGCVAGRRDIMEVVAQGRVTHAGTFNASPISMAAARATLEHLHLGGEALYSELAARGSQLKEGIRSAFSAHDVPCLVQGLPTVFNLMFTDRDRVRDQREALTADRIGRARFQTHLISAGVRISGLGNLFLSTAHTEEIMDQTTERFNRAIRSFLADGS